MAQIKIEKVSVTAKPRKLSAKWTIETASDIGLDLESELAALLADEIDWEIISSLLISEGWIKVEINYNIKWNVLKWVSENCIGETKHRNVTWLFKEPADATIFALKWA